MSEERQKFLECYPGFEVKCLKCNSLDVLVENTQGYSAESGSWGSVDLLCNTCGNRVDIAS